MRKIMSSNLCNYLLTITIFVVSIQLTLSTEDWKPILSNSANFGSRRLVEDRFSLQGNLGNIDSSSFLGPNSLVSKFHQPDQCPLKKVSFNQEGYFQYVEYIHKIPDLKEFTICMWLKFNNHSTDHPLFSYSVGDQSKAILSWVSNNERSSFMSLAVDGRTFYRLNYPFKLMRWYHSCQSWNGRTGEWQLWVDGERTGRGFYNRLIGHVIPGGGSAISGQNHAQLNGQIDSNSKLNSFGMMGQITMLQIYHVALTAGKAHKDHKHHHVHHFDHNGAPLEATTPANIPTPDQSNGLLQGRQLPYRLNLNFGNQGLVQAKLNNGLQYNAPFANGQFSPSRTISEQLITSQVKNTNGPVTFLRQNTQQYPQKPQLVFPTVPSPSVGPLFLPSESPSPANIQFLDFGNNGRLLFKRENKDAKSQVRNKRDNPQKEINKEPTANSGSTKKPVKRGLVVFSDGSIVDDQLLDTDTFEQSLLDGLAGLGENIPVQNIQKEQSDEREPAEAEVRAVMEMCSGCDEEPFQKALIMSWREVPLKLYRGSKQLYAVPLCKSF